MYAGALVEQIDDEDSVIRHHASLCLGKLVNTLTAPVDGSDPDPTSRMKEFFGPYLLGSDDSIVCARYFHRLYACSNILLSFLEYGGASGGAEGLGHRPTRRSSSTIHTLPHILLIPWLLWSATPHGHMSAEGCAGSHTAGLPT